VHALLVAAGPPPELPPELVAPPVAGRRPGGQLVGLPRRRAAAVLVLAAGLAAAAFGGGYFVGNRHQGFAAEGSPIVMRGQAPTQFASIQVGKADASGNWPLLLRVRGLKVLPKGGYYGLYLTEGGKIGPTCGTFRVHEGLTVVQLNAPYALNRWDGWVVVAHLPGQTREGAPILTT
jgi:hypothetical protein